MRLVPVSRLPLLALVVVGAVALASSPLRAGDFGNRALAVSPGAERAAPAVGSSCPTFSWALADEAESYQLVVLDLAAPERPEPVLEKSFAEGITSWTPSGKECLVAGGTYAWTVRALDGADQPIGGEAAWSAPLRFRVPGLPSAEELAAALAVLERWQAAGETVETGGRLAIPAPSGRAPDDAESRAPEVAGISAIRGENPATSGANFGVTGVSSSTAGAGLVGINLSTGPDGPDLILDGVANGEADTLFSQSGIDRPAAAAQTFNIQNSGAGAMALKVDGVTVDIATSAIAWSRLAGVPAGFADGVDNDTTYTAGNQLELAGTQFNVLEGPGSGLDADTLDGADGTSFQTRVTGICALGQAMQGVNADGSVVCVDMLVLPLLSTVDDDPDPANEVGRASSIAIGTDGFPVISYYDGTAGTLKVAKCNDGACSGNNETITTVDGLANFVGSSSSIVIGTDGFPVISYYDQTAGDLKVAKCNDAACTGNNETITTVDSSANIVGEYTSIAIGTDSFPVISYYDQTVSNLKIAKCNDAACTGNNETITTVDSLNNVGEYTSIAIGTDGFPVISYYDDTAASLKVAKCNDAACAGNNETITTVDNPLPFAVGQYTSIAIGTDGFPVISYHGASTGTLKVAKCNDTACAGNNETIITVDSSGNIVGLDTSIAIGADGLPVISYYDYTAGSLKVAKCTHPSCSF